MPKLQNFFVEFDNGNGVFFGGDVVKGRVVLILNEPTKMRNVGLTFKGSAKNKWTESEGSGESRSTVYYTAEEIYCNHELILWGGEETGTMEAGTFQYPFQFLLPPLCPTYFEGTSGHVRYRAEATIDMPWKSDQSTKAAISVLAVQDLVLWQGTSGHVRYRAEATIDMPWKSDQSTKAAISVLAVQDFVLWQGTSGHVRYRAEATIDMPWKSDQSTKAAISVLAVQDFVLWQGTSGHVRYRAEATIDMPWKSDQSTKAAISVLAVQDLNLEPNARRPFTAQNQKTLGCACCTSGDISVTVKVAKMWFVPGETIFAHIDATNDSRRKIKRIEIKVVQVSRYDAYRGMSHVSYADGGDLSGFQGTLHTRQTDRVLLERVYKEEIPEGSSRQWNNEQLLLPPCPDMLLACSIIHIDYILRIKIVPSGMSTSLELEAPFIVGNKPLIDAYVFYPGFNPNPEMGLSAPSTDPNSINPPFPEAPPPTYEKCVFGKSNIRDAKDADHTGGNAEFAPLYPSFPFQLTPN